MSENLESTLATLRNYVATNGLAAHVSMRLEGGRIRITLLAEERDLWLGRRYYLVSDPTEEPQTFFELNDVALSTFLALPAGADTAASQNDGSHFLFVSYSRRDERLVAPLVDLLRLTDTQVFRDRDSIRAGDRWRRIIEAAIEKSTECLVFWCEHALSSPEIAREVDLALSLGKKMVPVLLDDSPMSEQLKEFQAIDLRFFEPHAQAASETEPGRASSGLESTSSSRHQEAAATYLRQRLGDLLGVKPLLAITQEQPNIALEPTGTEEA